MNDGRGGLCFLGGVCVGALLSVLTTLAGCSDREARFRAEAIKRGYAHFRVIDEMGRVQFEWVEPKKDGTQ